MVWRRASQREESFRERFEGIEGKKERGEREELECDDGEKSESKNEGPRIVCELAFVHFLVSVLRDSSPCLIEREREREQAKQRVSKRAREGKNSVFQRGVTILSLSLSHPFTCASSASSASATASKQQQPGLEAEVDAAEAASKGGRGTMRGRKRGDIVFYFILFPFFCFSLVYFSLSPSSLSQLLPKNIK